jgi:carboxyl-terminal processing protease
MEFRYFIIIFALSVFPLYAQAQIDTTSDISAEDKIAGLAHFWSEANYNFAYFDQTGTDWDYAFREFIPKVLATNSTWEYYLVLKAFCALLQDGHTDVHFPDNLFSAIFYTPLRFGYIGGSYYVSNVAIEDSSRIKPGYMLTGIDGRPADSWLQDTIEPYISASTETEKKNEAIRSLYYVLTDTTLSIPMTFSTPDDRSVDYDFRFRASRQGWAREEKKSEIYEFTSTGDVAHVSLNSFDDSSIVELFRNDLEEIRKSRGIVIDLRKNGGGSTDTGASILMHFTSADSITGSAWKTRSHQASFKAWGTYFRTYNPDIRRENSEGWENKILAMLEKDYWYDGGVFKRANTTGGELTGIPAVVLAGPNTGSAAEDFLVMLRQLPDRKIPVIGLHTFGSTGQPLPLELPGGGSARICTKRDTFADGTDFVGTGIVPDFEIIPTVDDLFHGKDPALDKALEILQE